MNFAPSLSLPLSLSLTQTGSIFVKQTPLTYSCAHTHTPTAFYMKTPDPWKQPLIHV